MHAIITKNLTKYFFHRRGLFKKQKITAVNRINLTVEKGEIFGLLGPNGAGKTTLIKMLTTILTPSDGNITVNGFDLRKEEEKIKCSISLIYPGERSFYPRLTGKQNLAFFSGLYGIPSHLAKSKISELLEMVGLKDKADVWFEEYSSGMAQRLAVARGLLNNPDIIFMDEPTKSLDPLEAQKFRIFIKEFVIREQKKTVFLATHQLNEAEEVCSRIAILHLGEIRFCGSVGEVIGPEKKTLYDLFLEAVGQGKHEFS